MGFNLDHYAHNTTYCQAQSTANSTTELRAANTTEGFRGTKYAITRPLAGAMDGDAELDGLSVGLMEMEIEALTDGDGERLAEGELLGETLNEIEDEGESVGDSLVLGEMDGDSLALGLGDALSLADGETDGEGLVLEDPEALGLTDGLGEIEADGEPALGEAEEDGEVEGDGLCDADALALGEVEALGLILWEALELGDCELDGETLGLSDGEGEMEELGERL